MAVAKLKYSSTLTPSDPAKHPVTIIGQVKHLSKLKFKDVRMKLEPRVTEDVYQMAIRSLQPSSSDTRSLYLNLASVAALPSKCSRHNTPSRGHSLTKIVKSCSLGIDECFVIVCKKTDVFASACAIARAFPTYYKKTMGDDMKHTVTVEFLVVGSGSDVGEELSQEDLDCMTRAEHGVRLAARIVDTPCNEMNTDDFVKEVRDVSDELGIIPTIIRGEELRERGFGGIYGVGKAATHPPCLCVLSHCPKGATQTIAWVGKGIVYDTGGLSMKTKSSMIGMKRDCGGAAGVLGAFYLAVKSGFKENLHAVLCLAENAVGPVATRPDDIHTLYSGRTVEINNTDAEGRLVLADGVSYAFKDLKATTIVDMATLTGAQGTSTGKYHAAVLTNREEWEEIMVESGRMSGDLVHPMPYTPELHFQEFASSIADMKNSVADRSNAQPSCAALFILAHIGFEFLGTWCHIDMAAPVHCGERATGYGVALLATLFGHFSECDLLHKAAPLGKVNGQPEPNVPKKMRLE